MSEASVLDLNDLLDASPDGLLLVDAEGTIRLTNRRTEEIFRYATGSLIGASVEQLLPARLRAVHVRHRQTYEKNPQVRPMGIGRPLMGRCRDGADVPIEVSLSPVACPAGLAGVIATVREDSERRQAHAEATQAAVTAEDTRIATALLERIVGRLFESGLVLYGALDLSSAPVRQRIEMVLSETDEIIAEMRGLIFDIDPGLARRESSIGA